MPQIFAVTRTRGPAFNAALPLEEQAEWRAHADFMNALHAEGFVVLGGPLEGTEDILLIVRGEDERHIEAKFATDPWSRKKLLGIKQIAPWNIRLGSVG